MAKQHGRHTYVSIAAQDISTSCNTSTLERNADTHDTSGYSQDTQTMEGGLLRPTFSCGGVYDTSATAAPAELSGQEGQTLAIIYRIAGTGSGKPQAAFDGVLKKYTETAPVADMVSWSAEFDVSGDIDDTAQSA